MKVKEIFLSISAFLMLTAVASFLASCLAVSVQLLKQDVTGAIVTWFISSIVGMFIFGYLTNKMSY